MYSFKEYPSVMNNGSSMHKKHCYWFIWKKAITSDRNTVSNWFSSRRQHLFSMKLSELSKLGNEHLSRRSSSFVSRDDQQSAKSQGKFCTVSCSVFLSRGVTIALSCSIASIVPYYMSGGGVSLHLQSGLPLRAMVTPRHREGRNVGDWKCETFPKVLDTHSFVGAVGDIFRLGNRKAIVVFSVSVDTVSLVDLFSWSEKTH